MLWGSVEVQLHLRLVLCSLAGSVLGVLEGLTEGQRCDEQSKVVVAEVG